MNRIIHQAIPELDSDIRKFITEDNSTTVEIELRDLKTVLNDVVVEDYAEYRCQESTGDPFGGYEISIEKFMSDRVYSKILEFNSKNRLNAKEAFKPIEISEDGLELIEFLSDSEIKIDKLGYVIRNGQKTKEFWDGKIRTDK